VCLNPGSLFAFLLCLSCALRKQVPQHKLAEFENHSVELKKDPVVQEMPVQSLITTPSAGDILAAAQNDKKSVRVQGIAWGGGGEGVNRVDVSLDGGNTFTRANMLPPPVKQRRGGVWSWVFFDQEIPIPDDMRAKLKAGQVVNLELTSKALNTSWNVQPERAEPNRNPHGSFSVVDAMG
jgi:sulfite oxidase